MHYHLVDGLHVVGEDTDGDVVPLARADHTAQGPSVGISLSEAL